MKAPLFEIRYPRSAEHLKEAQRYLFLHRPSSVALYSLAGILILLNFGLWFRNRETLHFVLGSVLLLLVVLSFFMYWWGIRLIEKRERELFSTDTREVCVYIYDDRLELEEASGNVETEVTSLRKAFRTRNMILIQSKANLLWMLPTDAFIKGTPEGCVRFLVSKGIKVS